MAKIDPVFGTRSPGNDPRFRFDLNILFGTDNNDVLVGGAGDDRISGRKGNDTLIGGGGNDQIDGGDGIDTLFGQEGDDTFIPGAGRDYIYGGSSTADSGIDTVSYANYTSGVSVSLVDGYGYQKSLGKDADRDDLYGIENIVGSAYDDQLTGDDKVNRIMGGDGKDSLDGRDGDDHLDGGDGDDNLYGMEGNDTLVGGDGDDDLFGIEGSDILDGGAGEDDLYGGSEADTLTGGSGADIFHFSVTNNNGAWGRDTITDFTHEDTIELTAFFSEPSFIFQQAFDGIGGGAQIRYEHPQSGGTLIQVDFEGNGTVDKEIFLTNVVTLTTDDFAFF